jgi:hypothetical protein
MVNSFFNAHKAGTHFGGIASQLEAGSAIMLGYCSYTVLAKRRMTDICGHWIKGKGHGGLGSFSFR